MTLTTSSVPVEPHARPSSTRPAAGTHEPGFDTRVPAALRRSVRLRSWGVRAMAVLTTRQGVPSRGSHDLLNDGPVGTRYEGTGRESSRELPKAATDSECVGDDPAARSRPRCRWDPRRPRPTARRRETAPAGSSRGPPRRAQAPRRGYRRRHRAELRLRRRSVGCSQNGRSRVRCHLRRPKRPAVRRWSSRRPRGRTGRIRGDRCSGCRGTRGPRVETPWTGRSERVDERPARPTSERFARPNVEPPSYGRRPAEYSAVTATRWRSDRDAVAPGVNGLVGI